MKCYKFTITNTATTWVTFGYHNCDSNTIVTQDELFPGQSKYLWAYEDTIVSAFQTGYNLNNDTLNPIPISTGVTTTTTTIAVTLTPTPSMTPTETVTPTVTITPTPTPSITPTNTITPTPTPTPTESPLPPYRYYNVNGYGCGNPCNFVGTFTAFVPYNTPLTIGYFYNNPENRGYSFEILEEVFTPVGGYDLTGEPGYSDCVTSCYGPTPTPTPTPTNTETPTPTPTLTPNCVRQIVVPTLWNGATSINSNQLKLNQNSETLQIRVNDIITDNIGSTSFVGTVASDGTYTYVGTGPGGGVGFACQFPVTFSGSC